MVGGIIRKSSLSTAKGMSYDFSFPLIYYELNVIRFLYTEQQYTNFLHFQIEERYPTPKLPRLGPKPTASGGVPLSPPPKHTSVLPPKGMAAQSPGADSAVVRRTAVEIARRDLAKDGKKELTEPIPYYCANFILGDKWSTAKYLMFGGVFQVLATKGGSWGRSLLLKYPR